MSICTRCGAPFSCGMADGAGDACWCMRLPALVPVPVAPATAANAAGCWCPACLARHIGEIAPPNPAPPAAG
jgi:hypothetical protein